MGAVPQLFRIDPARSANRIGSWKSNSRAWDFRNDRDMQDLVWPPLPESWVSWSAGHRHGIQLGLVRTEERLDLMAAPPPPARISSSRIELKRDDTRADAHLQAIKYAMLQSTALASTRSSANDCRLRSGVRRRGRRKAAAATIGADDLNAVYNDQRIDSGQSPVPALGSYIGRALPERRRLPEKITDRPWVAGPPAIPRRSDRFLIRGRRCTPIHVALSRAPSTSLPIG